jgi:hypothetical protein
MCEEQQQQRVVKRKSRAIFARKQAARRAGIYHDLRSIRAADGRPSMARHKKLKVYTVQSQQNESLWLSSKPNLHRPDIRADFRRANLTSLFTSPIPLPVKINAPIRMFRHDILASVNLQLPLVRLVIKRELQRANTGARIELAYKVWPVVHDYAADGRTDFRGDELGERSD